MERSPFPPQFHPITTGWFRRRFGEPSPPQRLGWPLIAARQHTLILAPTGSGKTLAAFMACLDALIREMLGGRCSVFGIRSSDPAIPNTEHRTPNTDPGVRILYVSPLKALNYDIEKNLREPLAGLAEEARRQGMELPEIRVGVRTGDTRSRERQQMVRRPPHILITTPESLHLILTSQAKSMLSTVQFLILDEIHALCNNKRGVFTSLLLERLEEAVFGVRCSVFGTPQDRTPNTEHRTPNTFTRIGLSATQRPLEEVARFLGGAEWVGEELRPRPVEIVDAGMRKQLSLQVLCPVDDLANMEAGALWPGITRRLLSLLQGRKSTLIFANNRRQVERLTAQLNELAQEEIALPHHGSIAAPVRKVTEERLKRGDVRAVCATGTLELGIDMGAIELVCQVESPRQVSKGLQRVGRAGHLMTAVSEGRVLAKQPLDLLEAAVLAREMLAGRVESLRVPQNCLDVLAQQLVAIVADGERSLEELYRLVRCSYCYRELPEGQFQGTVAMISGRYPSHLFRDLQARVTLDRVRGRLLPLPGTRRAALSNYGTIPDTGQFAVYTVDGRVKLGELDEEFIYESRAGDVFSLGIDSWRIDRIEPDRVLVRPAPGEPARMPFWRGESYGRELELGQAMGEFITAVGARLDEPDVEAWIREQVPVDEVGARNLAGYLRAGRENCGGLPTHRTLLVESFEDEIGERRLAILSPLGRRVHLTLRLAISALLRERFGVEPEALHNDDGLLLRLPGGEGELPLDLLHQIPPERLWELVVGQLGSSPLFGLRFRQNAARALLLPGARPGKRTPLWLQRLKAKDLLTVAAEYDDFPIVLETYRECLAEFLAVDTVRELLEGLRDGSVSAIRNHRATPSPFAAALLFDFQAVYIYEWDRPKGIGRNATEAQRRLVADLVGHLRQTAALLDPRTIAEREARLQGTASNSRARTPAEFLELLRRLGDLPADRDAVGSRYTGDPDILLRGLCADRLIVQVPLPNAACPWHWILTEEWAVYEAVFGVRYSVFGEGCPNTEYRTPNTVRTAGDREAPVEEAVPAVFREPVPERSEEREDRRREALLSILRRFVLHRILASSEEVAAWYGLTMEETEAVLRDLEALGAVISVPGSAEESTASPIPHSPLTTDPSPLLWASPEHLEGAYAATLARWRREAKPASMAEYQRFLLHWQRRAGGGQRSAVGSRPDDSDHPVIRSSSTEGPDAVERALAQLQGLPLPATVWEGEVLARRVPGYQPVWLDQVCSTGEFLWQGSPGSFSGRGRVAFFQRELFPFWPGSGEWSAVSGEEGSVESLTTRIAELLERRGASFLLDLSLALGVDSRDVAVALWELIWAGKVTHDQWAVIRAGPPAGRPVPGAGGAVGTRHSGWGRAGRPGRGRPVFGSGGLSRGGSGGRYSWLPALRPAGGAVGTAESETAACREEETIGLVARQLLERYGIVARELLELEALPFSWGSLYPVLHGMELTGEVRRGYFVEGFSGAQFGLPRACDELKAIQERGALGASAFLLLNTCDPANLYGGAVRLQGPESESLSLPRLPGNYLVLRDGVPALLLETGSRRLSPLLTLTADELTAACQALRDLTEHRWPLRPVRQLRLERWGDRPIRGSEAEAPLREIGLSLSPKGLEL